METTKEVYIKNDPIIEDQQYVCLSFVMPENIKDSETSKVNNKYVDKFRMLKIRGCFKTYEEATQYALMLRDNVEPWVNVYVSEVGKWIPFFDDDKYAEDITYKEDYLNDLMKLHKE
jgi:hypothetical protein